MAFTFKHTGRKLQAVQSPAVPTTPSAKPIVGVKTPLAIGSKEILEVNYDVGDQVADDIRNLIQTNWGERLCNYNYGANLGPLMSELVSQEDFDTKAMQSISSAVETYMPYIRLNTFKSNVAYADNKGGLSVRIVTINYDIPAINIQNKGLEIVLYAM